jgi:outer membrane protein assembly factor BamB
VDLLAIGDSDFELAIGRIQAAAVERFDVVDLHGPLADAGHAVAPTSQFEGVTVDGAGRVFVLEESPGHVYVFDASLTRVLAKITLRVRPDAPGFAQLAEAWAAQPNSRGEGIVLLDRGHLLILKEKEPRRLIEFGSEGDQPVGLRPLGRNSQFVLKAEAEHHLVPLREWKLSDESKVDFPDLSDLQVDDLGRLWVLSDTGHSIGRIGTEDSAGRLAIESITRLDPAGGLVKPEGLALVAPGLAFVACDSHERQTPLFRVAFAV